MKRFLLVVAFLAAATTARADDEAPEARLRRGAVLVANAARWLQRGGEPARDVDDVYLDLEEVRVDDGPSHHEGFLRIWYRAPDAFRLAQRPERSAGQEVVKILNGDHLWFQTPDGAVREAGRDADGARARAQLVADRDRFAELARYLTLAGLDGEGVAFEDLGLVPAREEGLPEALRLVRRHAPGVPLLELAFEPAPAPRTVGDLRRVREAADPGARTPERRWRLDGWRDAPADGRRIPGRVEGGIVDDQGRWQRTLLAFPARVRVNGGLPDAAFAPPPPK
ncbi:MAG: hypothetical protein AB7T63_09815 [Planctomycetota bacterium]